MFDLIRRARVSLQLQRYRALQIKLEFLKQGQESAFELLRPRFKALYEKLGDADTTKFTSPTWRGFGESLERALLPNPPFDFLRNSVILRTMFVTAGGGWLRNELSFLESRFSEIDLQEILIEDCVGRPLLLNRKYLTSHNSIHHLYHLARLEERTGLDFHGVQSVVEWGGGYGNLAKIASRLSLNSTYTIIDIPLLSCLQWLYLTVTVGPERVNMLDSVDKKIESGKLNLLPVCFLSNHLVSGDLFISTWALSESSAFSQDLVRGQNWFGCKHLLLAYQENSPATPEAERVGKAAADAGASIEEISFLPKNYYAFR